MKAILLNKCQAIKGYVKVVIAGVMLTASLSLPAAEKKPSQGTLVTAGNPSTGWEVGLGVGVVGPLKHSGFFSGLRPTAGIYLQKSISPYFNMGLESAYGFNTSGLLKDSPHSSTFVDHSYLGLYGTVDIISIVGGYRPSGIRRFSLQPSIGAGWLHAFSSNGNASNSLASKFGINFNFVLHDRLILSLRPSVLWQLAASSNSTNSYNVNRAAFSLSANIGYRFGSTFRYIRPYDSEEIDKLNLQVNDLRSALAVKTEQVDIWKKKAVELEEKLETSLKRQPQVVKEVRDNLNATRFVFFRAGSSQITNDQKPGVEMIASYLKNHPESKVDIKGYASSEGNASSNQRLAAKRAESVKEYLIKNYKVAPERITASGAGVGHLFDEPSWNRVSVATILPSQK